MFLNVLKQQLAMVLRRFKDLRELRRDTGSQVGAQLMLSVPERCLRLVIVSEMRMSPARSCGCFYPTTLCACLICVQHTVLVDILMAKMEDHGGIPFVVGFG